MAERTTKNGRESLKKLAGTAAEKTFAVLELPPDMLSGMAHFEFSGNREAVIEGCRGILEYDENIVRLQAGKLTVRILGRGLALRNLRRDSAIVSGFITSVEFEP